MIARAIGMRHSVSLPVGAVLVVTIVIGAIAGLYFSVLDALHVRFAVKVIVLRGVVARTATNGASRNG